MLRDLRVLRGLHKGFRGLDKGFRGLDNGFCLPEVLVAAAILATALVTLAQLTVHGARSGASARDVTASAILAAQKLEELRSTAWGVDETGVPFGDAPQPGLDYLDRWGSVVGTGARPPNGAMYFRRWSVEPLPANPAATLMLHVRVGRVRGNVIAEERRPDDAWLLGARTRKAP